MIFIYLVKIKCLFNVFEGVHFFIVNNQHFFFQTINISKTVCLCDCPGLVFPTFVSTKAEMILNGILPVDQMRDYRPPATLVSTFQHFIPFLC